MSNIKTANEMLKAHYGDKFRAPIDLQLTYRGAEIIELRAALAKAEEERDALQAKLTALENQPNVGVVAKDDDGIFVDFHHWPIGSLQIGSNVYAAAGAAPTQPMTQARAEECAHRRCKRYRMDADAPYQFDAHTLMHFVRDVEKAGAAPAPEGWQPIETAPKDGAHVLLYRPEIQFSGYYGGENSGWRINAPGLPAVFPLPTHWMPLPAAPRSAS